MSGNVDAALAALGGDQPKVSADLPSTQAPVPAEVQALALAAAAARDIAVVAADVAKTAKERAGELASDLMAAMQEYAVKQIPMADRDAILLEAFAAKAGTPQNSMKGITATLEDSYEAKIREQWKAKGLDGDPDAEAVKKARELGKKEAAALWKALPRPAKPGGERLVIPAPHDTDEPTG